jgi:hypothetical protein
MKPAAREDAGENVPGGGDALAVLAANADCEIYFRRYAPSLLIICSVLNRASLGKLNSLNPAL